MLAGALVLGLWGPNLVRPPPPAWITFISLKGQTRRMKLGDLSLLRLNGATSVKVVFEDHLRRAVFEGGEAEFNVAPNGRPFLMAVGDRIVRTADADFDLRRYGRVGSVKAALTVRRGYVEVDEVKGREPSRRLGPGDQMNWIEGQASAPIRNTDPNKAFAWQSHQLVYDKTPLSDVVVDLNRYVDRPISLVPPSVGDLIFTGVLPLDNEEAMLKRLQATLPIKAQALTAAIVLKPLHAPVKLKAPSAQPRPPAGRQ